MPEPNDGFLPDLIVGYVSVRAAEGAKSVLQADSLANIGEFDASDRIEEAKEAIRGRGFQVLSASAFGLAVVGSSQDWRKLGGTDRLVTFEEELFTRAGRIKSVTHIGFPGAGGAVTAKIPTGSKLGKLFDAVVIERPRAAQGFFPTPVPPSVDRFHLRVPDDVAMILGADEAHRRGRRGRGVTVAMVDTGFTPHPFFTTRGYRIAPAQTVIPGTDPYHDPHGHGTGEAANVFAVAPDATLLPIRAATDRGDFVGGLAGFMLAKELLLREQAEVPDDERGPLGVISCSWGGDYPYPKVPGLPHPADRMLELEIRGALAKEIVVVFAAGNGTFGMEAQVPGVISAGGVYASSGLELEATPYASGYESTWYFVDDDERGGRIRVPAVCGLVGKPPRASYLMLPVPTGSRIDQERATAGRDDPPDGTSPFDGWALFSGTSAAAPQVAGAAAVLRGVKGVASPAEIAEVLRKTATDVVVGRCHPRFNHEAARGRDLATGAGLINVGKAVARWDPPARAPRVFGERPIPDAFSDELERQELMDGFLKLLATDPDFRKSFEKTPQVALVEHLRFDGESGLEGPLRLAPMALCKDASEAYKEGEPFDAADTTVRLTFMLA
jgi:subtilisin family serine protease